MQGCGCSGVQRGLCPLLQGPAPSLGSLQEKNTLGMEEGKVQSLVLPGAFPEGLIILKEEAFTCGGYPDSSASRQRGFVWDVYPG